MYNLRLSDNAISILFSQSPETRSKGGFQALLVGLQAKVDRTAGSIALSDEDIEKINRYIWRYNNGGWQKKLIQIFGRGELRVNYQRS